MATKNMVYDHPTYITRQSYGYGQNAAGASTNFGKFVAFSQLQVFAIQGANITAGTSTQTQWNGTGTVVNINGDQFYGIHVFGGNGVAASTATHGPFSLSYGTSTITTTAGVFTSVALSGTGTTGNVQAGTNTSNGGITMSAGDTFHVLRGTDATAVSAYAIEYGVVPLANVTL
jgi:hypothetical protein